MPNKLLTLVFAMLVTTAGQGFASLAPVEAASNSHQVAANLPNRTLSHFEDGPRFALRPAASRHSATSSTKPAAPATASTAPPSNCTGAWNQVSSPGVPAGNNELNATAAISVNDIWAVGDYVNANNAAVTLTEHWDGANWAVVNSPNSGLGDNRLLSVAAIATNNVWAVGFSRADNANSTHRQTLIEHWNGSSWAIVASPNAANASSSLFSVKGDSANDLWAVGRVQFSTNSAGPIALHWNGNSWTSFATATPSEFNELADVTVFSPNDVWAVGDQQNVTAGGAAGTLVEHFNGSGWFAPPALQAQDPNPGGDFLSGISGTATDFWAVGGQFTSSTTDATLAEHWNGNTATWTVQATPNPDLSADLIGVRYVSANNVYAFGASAYSNPGTATELDHTLIEQWNGAAWSQVTSPNPSNTQQLFDGAVISADDVWSVGFTQTTQPSVGTAAPLTVNYCVTLAVTSVTPNSGPPPGGTSVTIAGSGFTGASAVMFGTVAASSYTVNSDTQITATSPAQPGQTVDVTVTTPEGTSPTSSADHFTYVAPTPTVTNVNPNNGPTKGGTSVTITGTGLLFATSVKFGTVAATITSNTDTQIVATAPAQAQQTVDVTVTTAGGTSATSAADHYSYVAPLPAVTSVVPASGSPLGGTSVTITGTGFSFATSVSFGATPATAFTVKSDTSVTATSPAGALGTTVDVTVTTAGGTSATSSADHFTYAPRVDSISPTVGATSGGTSVTITGEGFTGATAVKFGTVNAANYSVVSDTKITATTPAEAAGTVDVTVTVATTTSATSAADHFTFGQGYWLVASDGGIFTHGTAGFFGSEGGAALNKPIVGMARTPDGKGYWLVASDGGIFTFGDAPFKGSTGSLVLNKPIVGMAATPSGQGYWLVASDGGIFTFGDAPFKGSTGSLVLNKPVVGMAATPSGQGYWLVASDGGIFTFGDASFKGSTGSLVLNKPIVGMASTPSGQGYWLVASDGGIFTFGDATFKGSTGSIKLNKPVVGMAATADGQGYWLVASDGGIFTFGDATFLGSEGGLTLTKPIVGIAAQG